MRAYFLKTDRLGFARWQEGDFDLALSLWGNPEVTKYISANGIFTEEQIQSRLNKEIDNDKLYGVQYWPIFHLETNEHIGCCGLRPYDLEKGIYELGFHLKSQYWGKGYAFEAASAAIRFAFENLKAANLFAGHNPNNAASKKLLEKLGFKYTHDEFYPPTGLKHPSYLFYESSASSKNQ